MEIINISNFLGNNLMSRPLAHDLLYYMRNSDKLNAILDFAGVEFMTRSFADEFYNLFLSGKTADVNVRIENMSEDMQAMIDVVRRTQNVKWNNMPEIKAVKPKDFNAMDSYFASLSV